VERPPSGQDRHQQHDHGGRDHRAAARPAGPPPGAGGPGDVDGLAAPVTEPGERPSGVVVVQGQRHLDDAGPGASRIDRHPDLEAEAGRRRQTAQQRAAHRPLARQRLDRLVAARSSHQPPRRPLDRSEPTPPRGWREGGDGEVGGALEHRVQQCDDVAGGGGQVGVDEQVHLRVRGEAHASRHGIALAPDQRQGDDGRAGRRGASRGVVGRPVVHHDDAVDPTGRDQLGDGDLDRRRPARRHDGHDAAGTAPTPGPAWSVHRTMVPGPPRPCPASRW
jgi:hypothetical protein